MAEKPSFPQIPSTVWWGLRSTLRNKPQATVDETFLAVNLKVQPAASRQYVAELKRVGLLSDDGKATALAMKWRNDATYRDAADEIANSVYPVSLVEIAPPGQADRAHVIDWFMLQGLGAGTAKNKTATYLLIANEPIQDAPEAKQGSVAKPAPKAERSKPPAKTASPPARQVVERRPARPDAMPLNVNVQIHISADASGDQIETIFSAMRRYLYDDAA